MWVWEERFEVLSLLFNVDFLFSYRACLFSIRINRLPWGKFPFRVGRENKACLLSLSPDQVATALLLRYIEVRLGQFALAGAHSLGQALELLLFILFFVYIL
jgi:hypothetical protein